MKTANEFRVRYCVMIDWISEWFESLVEAKKFANKLLIKNIASDIEIQEVINENS